MTVVNTLDIIEIDSEEQKALHRPKMEVMSHWNRDSLVRLKVGEHIYTLDGSDLDRAIRNARNWK